MVCFDTKTHWNSLLAMLERFLEMKSAIIKALIDIKDERIMANVKSETVTTFVSGFKKVKISLEKLSSPNATLLIAEGVFSSVIWKIERTKFRICEKYEILSNPKN
ncbi:uncharacterized protein TNCV_3283611 [Trichonephila clavipes]|nr:uncharacterized protein TNCV_3283611 [Trichonephila clavipes]